MKLSRRSLILSLIVHCSLVSGGYFLIKIHDSQTAVIPLEQGQVAVKVVSRPVRVEPKRPVQKSPSRVPTKELQVGKPSEAKVAAPVEPVSPTSTKPVSQKEAVKSPVAVTSQQNYPEAVKRPASGGKSPRKPKGDPEPSQQPTPESGPVGWGPITPRPSPNAGGGEGGERSLVTRRAMPYSRPEFNLTKRFPELAEVEVKVEFKIAEDGSCEPILLTSSGNLTADVTIKARLAEFKWRPALDKGIPIVDTRTMDISLDDS